ncbi:DUF262 domain-containing protein [Radiobacillus sp. PE A8.2]|uniref:GmrSD restriction endonuclease domain-containing protein n=1 Tax=Radiobacillus sp. PE A8.2 TaxID=3380349 RepID=UPI00388EFC67
MDTRWKVDSTASSKSIYDLVNEINKGLKGEGGIRLDPEYQREYKFSVNDESLLIESLLIGIPIPIIYLSSDTTKIPYMSNVIDGQHRLRAVYRFVNNEFALKGLDKLEEYNDKRFSGLPIEIQAELLHQCSLTFENIHVQNNPDLELEIFKRYNTGSHPLSRQEIRHAVYRSEINEWLNAEIDSYYKDEDKTFRDIYNITKKRFSDKTAHENIQTMLYILDKGLNKEFETSPEYAEEFMKLATLEKQQTAYVEKLEDILNKANKFFLKLYKQYNITYPLSKELYGVESRNYKVQIPILMILAAFLNELFDKSIDTNNDETVNQIYKIIETVLKDSYLETSFKGSSTRPELLSDTANKLIKIYFESI